MITIQVNLGAVDGLDEKIKNALEIAVKTGAQTLARDTFVHIQEEANKTLKTRKDMFIKSMSFKTEDENTWVINLDAKAVWINDGQEAHEMIDDFLKSKKAKTGKNGKYLRIPFNHGPGKGPSNAPQAQIDLSQTIKKELQKRNIPYGGIEKDSKGAPKIGLLHSLDIKNNPLKTKNGPGMGHGKIGDVRQGNTGTPFLQGIRIYQKEFKTKEGKNSVRKEIMTFRTVSSSQKGSGKWVHPGLKPTFLFENGAAWAIQHWENKLIPQIQEQLEKMF